MKKLILLTFSLITFGSWVQEPQAIAPFTSLQVFGPFQVELIKSNKEAIEMEVRGVDKEDVVVSSEHGVLKVKLKNRHYVNQWRDENDIDYIKTRIYYVSLDHIQAEAAAKIKSQEPVTSKNLELICSKGAWVYLQVSAREVHVKTSMGGETLLKGKTEFLEVHASMGAEYKSVDLESKVVFVKATMGAEVDVYASHEIDISAGLGADVKYSGGPVVRHSNATFGADVRGH